ncbi:hypothetical protein [Methylosinus sp. Sm6]|uniref:hypothetical protein n=1 Tax=Methylosinus sp. Sm6 TaxID=2866948 RepID=UPI001C99B15C|nr:hypothetical protein [Methylosinus sp. Sm6]MBY6243966.1 hypothetical protein [Methylosinus sp. Sm6]
MTVVEAVTLLLYARKATAKDVLEKSVFSDNELLARFTRAREFEERVLIPLSTGEPLPHLAREQISLELFSAWYSAHMPFEPWEAADLAASQDWASFFRSLFETGLFRSVVLTCDENSSAMARVRIVAGLVEKIATVEADSALAASRTRLKAAAATARERVWRPISSETQEALQQLFGDVSPCGETTAGGVIRQLLRSPSFKERLRCLGKGDLAGDPFRWRFEPPRPDQREALAEIFETLARDHSQANEREWLPLLDLALDDMNAVAASLDLGNVSDLLLADEIAHRREPTWAAWLAGDRIGYRLPGSEQLSIEIDVLGSRGERLNETHRSAAGASEGTFARPAASATDAILLAVKTGDETLRLVRLQQAPPAARHDGDPLAPTQSDGAVADLESSTFKAASIEPYDPKAITVVEAVTLLFYARRCSERDIVEKSAFSDEELLARYVRAREFEERVLVPLSSGEPAPHVFRDYISLPLFSAWYAAHMPFEPWEAAELAAAADWPSFFRALFETGLFRSVVLTCEEGSAASARAQVVAGLIQKIELAEAAGVLGPLRKQWKALARAGRARAWLPATEQSRGALQRLFGDVASPCQASTVGGVIRQLLRSEQFGALLRRLRAGEFADAPQWRFEPPRRDQREALGEIFTTLPAEESDARGRSWLQLLDKALDDLEVVAGSLDLADASDLLLADEIARRREPRWQASIAGDAIAFRFPGAEQGSLEIDLLGAREEQLNETPLRLAGVSEGTIPRPASPVPAVAEGDIADGDAPETAPETVPLLLAVRLGDDALRLVRLEPGAHAAPATARHDSFELLSARLAGSVVRVEIAGPEPLPKELFFSSNDVLVWLDGAPLPAPADAQDVPAAPAPDGRATRRYFGAGAFASGPDAGPAGFCVATDRALSIRIEGEGVELAVAADDVAFSAPRLEAGHIAGWAFAPEWAAHPQRVTVTARASDPERGFGERSFAQALGQPSPEPALDFGRFAEKAGYRIALPAYLLDGEPYLLSAEIGSASQKRLFAQLEFRATDEFLAEQIAQAESGKDLETLLVAIAEAGRGAAIAQFYARPAKLADKMSETAHIRILATLVVKRPAAVEDEAIRRTLDACWRSLLADPKQLASFVTAAMQASLSGTGGNDAARFPLQPMIDSLVDLLLMSEKLSPLDADTYSARVANALAYRRIGVARGVGERARRKHPTNPAVLAEVGRLAWALGQTEDAKAYALAALKAKAGFGKAQMLLARTLVDEDRPLDAVSIVTNGAGLSAAAAVPASYEVSQIAARLDWRGFSADSAAAAGKETVAETLARSADIHGGGEEARSFSVFFVGKTPSEMRAHQAFVAYGDSCVTVSPLEGEDISIAPAVSEWAAFMFDDAWAAERLQAIFRQLRPFELVVRLVVAGKAAAVETPAFKTRGLIVKSDILGAFGSCTLEQFVAAAERRLKVKTILMREQPL